MNDAMAATSECSSGVESGWTLYLEHSYINHNNNAYYHEEEEEEVEEGTEKRRNKKQHHEDSADEEDLSMLSDASSWPPHHDPNYFNNNHQQNNYYENHQNGSFSNSGSKSVKLSSSTKTKKNKVKEIQHMPSYLHDTASSHVFDFSPSKVDDSNQQTYTESMLDCSQGFSATYFQRKSSCQEHFGFFQPSLSENEIQGNNSWYGGKGIGMR
ncbi:hypothetical protein PIB30_018438 [Stylosanthes scabra]|uniref:Uncharacterized protein n=1 Tax=Stylosanthes scabra TaxID=79078 RepID=A0ABU6U9N1_9FABA|nr:hypothetical protein [Stylosanthes scabra]